MTVYVDDMDTPQDKFPDNVSQSLIETKTYTNEELEEILMRFWLTGRIDLRAVSGMDSAFDKAPTIILHSLNEPVILDIPQWLLHFHTSPKIPNQYRFPTIRHKRLALKRIRAHFL